MAGAKEIWNQMQFFNAMSAHYGLTWSVQAPGCDNETAAFLRSAAGKQSSVHWHCASCDNSIRALHDMVSTINK